MLDACPYRTVFQQAYGSLDESVRPTFPLMPVGQACDMGHRPDGTPLIDPRLFDSSEFQRNPYPYYRILRDHYPVFHDAFHNAYWVTRYDDVTNCYLDEEGFNTIPKGMSSGVLGNTQLELSGIEHRRRRNLYGRHLIGKALDRRLGVIESLAAEMIDAWFVGATPERPEGSVVPFDPNRPTNDFSVELGAAFANEFPIRVVCQVLGFPNEARSQFVYWYASMMNGLGGSETAHKGIEARQDLEDFVEELVAERRQKPTLLYDDDGNPIGPDIISELCASRVDGDFLSTEEITSNIALIVGGGGETTRGAILNLWYLLLQHQTQFDAVRTDRSLWDAAFHEMLRHSSSIGGQPRHNSWDLTMHGVNVPAGSLMNMVDFSANHDERVFHDPETYDLFRTDLYTGKILRSGFRKDGRASHMAFGVGPHLCPGAWISQQETTIGSRVISDQLSSRGYSIEIDADRTPKDIDGDSFAPIGLGAIRSLWLRLRKN